GSTDITSAAGSATSRSCIQCAAVSAAERLRCLCPEQRRAKRTSPSCGTGAGQARRNVYTHQSAQQHNASQRKTEICGVSPRSRWQCARSDGCSRGCPCHARSDVRRQGKGELLAGLRCLEHSEFIVC